MKKILSILILFFAVATGYSQSIGTFKSLRLVNVLDSTTITPVNATIYYNEQSGKLRAYENGVWKDLIGGGGSGDSWKTIGATNFQGGDVEIFGTDEGLYFYNMNSVQFADVPDFNIASSTTGSWNIGNDNFRIQGSEAGGITFDGQGSTAMALQGGAIQIQSAIDLQDNMFLSGEEPTQITANQNNYIFTGNWNKINSDAARNITGLDNPIDGQVITFTNNGSFNITFKHDDAGSTTDNRFDLNGSDVILEPDKSVSFVYNGDGVKNRWVLFSTTLTSAGSGITNTAAANEIAKSDGTNLVPSGLESTTAGDINLGLAATTGTSRLIQAAGSELNITTTIRSKGIGNVDVSALNGGNVNLNATSGSGQVRFNANVGIVGDAGTGTLNFSGGSLNFLPNQANSNEFVMSALASGNYFTAIKSSADQNGVFTISTGNMNTSGIVDPIRIKGGDKSAGSTTGKAGDVFITAGIVTEATATGDAGDIILESSSNAGSGTEGDIILDITNGGTSTVNYGSTGSFNITGIVQSVLLSGTTLTLNDDLHRGKIIYCTNGSGITITVPSGLPLGFNVVIMQDGAGTVSLSASGTTINGKTSTTGQYDAISLAYYKSSENYIGL